MPKGWLKSNESKTKRWLKSCLRTMGYRLINRKLRWGVDVWDDLQRLLPHHCFNVIFDVGANVGQSALFAAAAFPKAKIYSFEPVPSTFDLLEREVKKYPLITPVPLALGSEVGKKNISAFSDSRVNSFIANSQFARKHEGWLPLQSIPVEVSTVDKFSREKKVNGIDLLKIDVEGAELDVLAGSVDQLKERTIKAIYVEFNSLHSVEGNAGGSLDEIVEFLTPYHFRLGGLYTEVVFPKKSLFAVRNALFVSDTN